MNKRKKQNPDKMDFIKIKNFYSAKDLVKKKTTHYLPMTHDKEFISRICKASLKYNCKK